MVEENMEGGSCGPVLDDDEAMLFDADELGLDPEDDEYRRYPNA